MKNAAGEHRAEQVDIDRAANGRKIAFGQGDHGVHTRHTQDRINEGVFLGKHIAHGKKRRLACDVGGKAAKIALGRCGRCDKIKPDHAMPRLQEGGGRGAPDARARACYKSRHAVVSFSLGSVFFIGRNL